MGRSKLFAVTLVVLGLGLPVDPANADDGSPWKTATGGAFRSSAAEPDSKLQLPVLKGGSAPATLPADRESRDRQGRLLVEVRGDDLAAVRAAVDARGGAVVSSTVVSVLANVPDASLAALAGEAAVSVVALPDRPRPTSEAVDEVGPGRLGATNAVRWHDAGFTGAAAKVAVVDVGFDRYEEFLGSTLPDDVTTINHCGAGMVGFDGSGPNGDLEPTGHGTAMAEVVHAMAPDAELILICVFVEADVRAAVDDLTAQGARIATMPITDPIGGRGDGSGPVGSLNETVQIGRARDQLWIVPAGSQGTRHFQFTLNDNDNDGAYEMFAGPVDDDFADPAELQSFQLSNGEFFFDQLKWDTWPVASRDVALCYWQSSVSPGNFIGCSPQDQSASAGPPQDFVFFRNTSGFTRTYWMAVLRDTSTPLGVRGDIFFDGQERNIKALTPGSSIGSPGDSPFALAVGVACYSTGALEPYSSRGPTIDGRPKPDLVGPHGVSSSIYGPAGSCSLTGSGFLGESAAIAHTAGAAALVLGAAPDLSVARLQLELELRARGPGPYAKANDIGAGLLDVDPAPPPPPTSPDPQPASTRAAPVRVLDTRLPGPQAGALASGATLALDFDPADVPADATTVIVNVTAVSIGAGGYLTIFPRGQPRPFASNVNFGPGAVAPNHVTAAVGDHGGQASIDIFNFGGPTHVVVDLAGYYGPDGIDWFTTLDAPLRAIDTRLGTPFSNRTTRLASDETFTFDIAGPGRPVPAGATAVALNVTVTEPSSFGFLAIVPSGASAVVSNLNFTAGETRPNLVVARVDDDGEIDIDNSVFSSVHVIVDVIGYYTGNGDAGYVALTPVRNVDTRVGTGLRLGRLIGGQTVPFQMANIYGIPTDAIALQLNTTITEPVGAGFLTVWAAGSPLPLASNLNYVTAQTIANGVIARVGTGDNVSMRVFPSATHVVNDTQGYFAARPEPISRAPA